MSSFDSNSFNVIRKLGANDKWFCLERMLNFRLRQVLICLPIVVPIFCIMRVETWIEGLTP